ncbi:MAG TPA: hypothetical protein VEP90_09325, partial [Methylomirabilota bacterium]|nr:hypothetical protein [Methylomirabilota bacterium]
MRIYADSFSPLPSGFQVTSVFADLDWDTRTCYTEGISRASGHYPFLPIETDEAQRPHKRRK